MLIRYCWLLLFISCQSKRSPGPPTQPITVEDTATAPQRKVEEDGNTRGPFFDQHLPFEISSSITDRLHPSTTDDDTAKCRTWKLTAANIEQIIKNGEPIDGTTWDLQFSIFACVKDVKILQRGQVYDVSINAASFFSISNADSTILFGDYKKADRKFFLASGERPEE
jgi:hypothetical protein